MTASSPRPGTPLEVLIGAFPSAPFEFRDGGSAFVVVDVIRATTTAITAAAMGRTCYLAPTVDAAVVLARTLNDPITAGEIGGNVPFDFELNNSPADMAARSDLHRPVVLVSSSGTLLAHNAASLGQTFLACLRNVEPTVRALAGRYPRIVVIGAGSRGEFREEDQACCARIAKGLVEAGYAPGSADTDQLIQRWSDAPTEAWLVSNSVRFLRTTGQERDLEFILTHRDDVEHAYRVDRNEVLRVPSEPEVLTPIAGGASGGASETARAGP